MAAAQRETILKIFFLISEFLRGLTHHRLKYAGKVYAVLISNIATDLLYLEAAVL